MTHSTLTREPTQDVRRDGVRTVADGASEPRPPRAAPSLVVGYDGSLEARAAVAAAIERAGPDGAVVAVHVTSPPSSWIGTPYYEQSVEDRLRDGQAVLDELRDDIDGADADVAFEMIEGDPAEVLTRVAAVRDADEIVIGARGLGRIRAALGSVSQAILRVADRPVLVVPADAA